MMINYIQRYCASIALASLVFSNAIADETHIIPDHEYTTAQKMGFSGPKENHGIASVTVIGKVPLKGQFPTINDRVLRSRVIAILPNGRVGVHRHDSRPGLAYMLEGELIEHRADENKPLLRKKGDASFEKTGVIHWWENKGLETAKVLVVDIVQETTQ